ncbi:MAG TPA: dATP/dGTP diphosphohydrolase domain-containing protein, partial [Candidatus Omnitrophota bacterium]|nr:dATP/dGTP diphosphohydrolase domain-containing protein [Candidatus Omnitrophota bacterium]
VDFCRETIQAELGQVVNRAARRNQELAARLQEAERQITLLLNRQGYQARIIDQQAAILAALPPAITTDHMREIRDKVQILESWRASAEPRQGRHNHDIALLNSRHAEYEKTLGGTVDANRKILAEVQGRVEKVGANLADTVAVLNVRDKEVRDKIQDLSKAVATVVAWIPNAHKDRTSIPEAPGQTLVEEFRAKCDNAEKASQGEADPTGKAASEPGAKLDAGKPDADLLLDFGRALIEVAKVCTYGAKKYSRGGWQHVTDGPCRYTSAMIRHLTTGRMEAVDRESGLLHDAQVAWNALARLELRLRQASKDACP